MAGRLPREQWVMPRPIGAFSVGSHILLIGVAFMASRLQRSNLSSDSTY